jgi:hypothetical protein
VDCSRMCVASWISVDGRAIGESTAALGRRCCTPLARRRRGNGAETRAC